MTYQILEKNGEDNTNVDGATMNNFAAGGRNGIMKGVLNECAVFLATPHSIGISTGEMIVQGFRVKLTDLYSHTFSALPARPIRYQLVAMIMLDLNRDVAFDIVCREEKALMQDALFVGESGRYEVEIARFTHTLNGIEDLVRTMDIITGGTGSSSPGGIIVGQVTTNTLAAGMEAEVDVETVERNGRCETDFKFSIPEPSQEYVDQAVEAKLPQVVRLL